MVYPDPEYYDYQENFLGDDTYGLQESWAGTLRDPDDEDKKLIEQAINNILLEAFGDPDKEVNNSSAEGKNLVNNSSAAGKNLVNNSSAVGKNLADNWAVNIWEQNEPLSDGEHGDVGAHYTKVCCCQVVNHY